MGIQKSAGHKMRILLEGMNGEADISELCRREGLPPGHFYQWKKQ